MGTANLQELRVLFDESVPVDVVNGLRALKVGQKPSLKKRLQYRIEHFYELEMAGVDDLDWIPAVSKFSPVVISNDDAIFRVPDERKLLLASSVGFISCASHNKRIWQQARDLLRHWDQVEDVLDQARPFGYRLNALEFKAYDLRHSAVSEVSTAKRKMQKAKQPASKM